MGNPAIAILLAVIAYTMLNIGFVLQKKGASTLPKVESQDLWGNVKNFLTNKIWLAGFILTGIQWLFYMMALDFGSMAVVAPVLGWGVVVLVLFSFYYLHEPISRAEIMCFAGIITGIVILGVTSPETTQELTIATVYVSFSTPGSIVFLALIGSIIFIPPVILWKRKAPHGDIVFGLCSGFAATIGAIFSNALVAFVSTSELWISLGAALGNLFFWLSLFLLVGGNMGSMVFQQVAYQRGKVSLVNTIYTVVCVILPVVAGAVIYGEWVNLDPTIAGIRVVAILLVAGFAGALSNFNVKNQEPLKDQKEENKSMTKVPQP